MKTPLPQRSPGTRGGGDAVEAAGLASSQCIEETLCLLSLLSHGDPRQSCLVGQGPGTRKDPVCPLESVLCRSRAWEMVLAHLQRGDVSPPSPGPSLWRVSETSGCTYFPVRQWLCLCEGRGQQNKSRVGLSSKGLRSLQSRRSRRTQPRRPPLPERARSRIQFKAV